MNAKNMLDLLRDYVGEASAAHWTDVNLLRRLNAGQKKVSLMVAMSPGRWLLKRSGVLTPVASVVTLPTDCAKPLYIEEVSSERVMPWLDGGIKFRRVSRGVGTSLDLEGQKEVYPVGNTIEINASGYTKTVYVWYERRVPDLYACSTLAAASAGVSITFNSDMIAKNVADYYNGVAFEATGGTGEGTVDEITDYTAARVATVSGTYSTDTELGTVSVLPEETHDLIVLEAAVMALTKPSSTLDREVFVQMVSERTMMRKLVVEWLESRVGGGGGVAIGDLAI